MARFKNPCGALVENRPPSTFLAGLWKHVHFNNDLFKPEKEQVQWKLSFPKMLQISYSKQNGDRQGKLSLWAPF